VTIGVAFFTGVAGTADIMSVSVDRYSDETNLKDITVYSNYGFDDEDVEAVQQTEEVLKAQGAKFTDVIGVHGNDSWVTRIHSLPADDSINNFVLVSGRYPQNEHEALAENGSELEPGFPLGERIDVILPDGSKNEDIVSDYFIITGTVDTPLYLNEIKENSTLSNQYIRTYLYVNEDVFATDYYTELNVLSKNGKAYNSFTKPYETYSAE
jgi:putative ABC transport system permease protein